MVKRGENGMPQPEPIDPGKYNFPTLMNDIENGRVRLPPFQREFVWGLGKVIDLMDSIYKGFPSVQGNRVGQHHVHFVARHPIGERGDLRCDPRSIAAGEKADALKGSRPF
jgi:hypothetical protein